VLPLPPHEAGGGQRLVEANNQSGLRVLTRKPFLHLPGNMLLAG
jgi:hypothetical protein